jgi:hypothetical protein
MSVVLQTSPDEDKIAIGEITQCSIYITNLLNQKI